MDLLTLTGIALALAMDAFAVALSAGVLLNPVTRRQLFRLGFHFGLFQGGMPVIGWLAGIGLKDLVTLYAPWIAFLLLALVGGKMIYEALLDRDEKRDRCDPTRGVTLIMLSIATSIDALAVGFSLSLLDVTILTPAITIGAITAILTVAGMLIGGKAGTIWGERVELFGGVLLIAIGLRILMQSS